MSKDITGFYYASRIFGFVRENSLTRFQIKILLATITKTTQPSLTKEKNSNAPNYKYKSLLYFHPKKVSYIITIKHV